MIELDKILEETLDDQEFIVTFTNGDVFSLTNFEMVDKSIYGRSDLCVGDIVSIIKCTKNVYNVGNGLEFALKDVTKVTDIIKKNILYEV